METKTPQKEKINLRRLLLDEKENVIILLEEIVKLLSFENEVSLYDNEMRIIASTSKQPADSLTIPVHLGESHEIEKGLIFNFTYQETPVGFIFIQKGPVPKEIIFNLAGMVKNLLNEIIKLKLEKKELLQEILTNYREINLLYKFGGNISAHLGMDSVLENVLMESKNIIAADNYIIQLLDKKTNTLQTKTFLGDICPSSDQTHPDRVIARMVFKTGNPQIVNDIKEKQKVKDCECGINSAISVPLKTNEEVYGVLTLSSRKENYFKARDEKLLLSLTSQAAIAIENYYLEQINWENKRQLALKTIINEEQEKEYREYVSLSLQTTALGKMPADPVPYLICGEYGVGKKLLAREVHRGSQRKDGPFIPVDCGIFSSSPLSHKLLFGSSLGFKQKKSEVDFSYMELAEGGTLFLQNVDRLPKELGEKLSNIILTQDKNNITLYKDIRIAAETSVSLDKKVEKGEFDRGLYKILTQNTILLPSLRERKKDIIKLTEYFIKKYSGNLGKKIDGIDSKAYEKLLNYHYQLGNIKELKQIIERACILTESNIIPSDYIFLGVPPAQTKFSFNLLNIKPINYLIKKGFFPHPFAYVSSLFVLLIYYFAFFGKNKFTENPGTFLAWSLWWPFFIFSFFFFGRIWCSICPINEYGIILRKIKHFNLEIPSFIKNNTHYFITIGFLLVLWVEEAFVMRFSAFRTGLIMGTIFSAAALTNILFQRHTYCRYICPLGWSAGFFSFFSIIELRSNPNICANKCKTHDCFKGNKNIEGCPMFLHPQFVDTNLLCKLCMRCVRLCPNDSPQLNFRLPGWDIVSNEHLGHKTSLLIIALLSVPYSIVLFESKWMHQYYSFFNFTLLFWTLPVIMGLIIWGLNYIFLGPDKKNNIHNFFDVINVYIPIALAAHVSLQLKYIPVFPKININANLLGTDKIFSFSLLNLSQTILILSGLVFSYLFMYLRSSRYKEKHHAFYYISHHIIMFVYCLSFLYFLI
ncbi:MAG: sigma 54-interacting transcriptional regulator [bacterium]|nr:sigma 54-interacting transcriptional regulator [bacterium]